ncbi:HlyD family secretion protein [Roseateles sp. UC29_93]|uniref:HlyD family secretion protein n=1 Tax=Roseateles sp. UC29_93 TaxID=3350177 RepID=UPI00366A6810
MKSLFRHEVNDSISGLQAGGIVLIQPPSHRLYAAFAVLCLMGLLSALAFVKYTRHVELQGVLEPAGGVAKIYAPQTGVLREIRVRQGQHVGKGEILMVFATEHMATDGNSMERKLDRSAEARLQTLREELDALHQVHRDEVDNVLRSLQEQRQLDPVQRQQIAVLQQRLAAAQGEVERYQGLQQAGFASQQMVDSKQADLLDQRVRLDTARHDLLTIGAEVGRLTRELSALPQRHRVALRQTERALEQAQAESMQLRDGHEWSVVAPVDGVIASIDAFPGQPAAPTAPVATVTPSSVPLVARLYAPSKSIGFLDAGRVVRLKVDAFPYQKFGMVDAVLDAVALAPQAASELSALSRLAVTPTEQQPEPTFSLTALLASQSISAYGRDAPLRPGMQVSAIVELDERRLYEWVLEPLFESGHFKVR